MQVSLRASPKMETIHLLLWISLAIPFLYYLAKATSQKLRPSAGNARLPPGPTPLPIIGNVFDLRGELHLVLANLAKTYGPVMTLKLGLTTTVVVSSREAAREVLQKHDQALAARPPLDVGRAFGHNDTSILWLPSSSPLRKQFHSISVTHLFSTRGLEAHRTIRERKVRELVASFRRHAGQPVEIGHVVFGGVINLISNILFSSDVVDLSSDAVQEFLELIEGSLQDIVKSNISDLFPFLSALDLQGRRRSTASYVEKFYNYFGNIIDRRLSSKTNISSEKSNDFLDELLKLSSMDKLDRRNIQAFLNDLFVGGSDTTADTVQWVMAELLRNPSVMAKARAEVREALGSKETVDESDIAKLPYLQAVMKETLRLHPPGSLMMPHFATEDGVEISGFAVPKGTSVIVNTWAIMRDPETWEDPEAFIPQRFLDKQVEYRGREFEYLPFGAGRKGCPGLPMAVPVVMLILASMLHEFEWKLPDGMVAGDVDVRERFAAPLAMVVPVKAVPVPIT